MHQLFVFMMMTTADCHSEYLTVHTVIPNPSFIWSASYYVGVIRISVCHLQYIYYKISMSENMAFRLINTGLPSIYSMKMQTGCVAHFFIEKPPSALSCACLPEKDRGGGGGDTCVYMGDGYTNTFFSSEVLLTNKITGGCGSLWTTPLSLFH